MSASASPAKTRRRSARGEGEALRDELLDAAERQLLKAGSMEAVSIRSIVNEVGVSPPALYMHFEDKDDLFFAVCQRRFSDFGQVLLAAAEGLDDPVERLRAMGIAYVRYGVEHGEHYQIMFGPGSISGLPKERIGEDARDMLALTLLTSTVAEAIESGRFHPADVMLTSMTIWSAVHGVVMLQLEKGNSTGRIDFPDPDLLQENVCDVILRGLTAA